MVTRVVTQNVVGVKSAGTAAQAVRQQVARNVTKPLARAVRGTLGLTGERMSRVDTAWLHMDSPSNLMMIVGVWSLKPGLSLDALRERVEQRLMLYPRFRQRVVEDAAGATWVTDSNFDITRHVVVEKLPAKTSAKNQPSAQQALQQRVAELAMQPLDRKRPLWQFHLVEDYQGGSALVVRSCRSALGSTTFRNSLYASERC